jgi:hypothetical protein
MVKLQITRNENCETLYNKTHNSLIKYSISNLRIQKTLKLPLRRHVKHNTVTVSQINISIICVYVLFHDAFSIAPYT